MGLDRFGIPEKEVEYLKEELGLEIFVEGGTFKGQTSKKMSHLFDKVFTVENSDVMFAEAKEFLKGNNNVTIFKGDTREYLGNILEENDKLLFWLDAHWSGGATYGANDECPLLEELDIIFNFNKEYVILIDDARLFLASPPEPHKFNNWPGIIDVVKKIPAEWEMLIFEDVIYIIPQKIKLDFKRMIQKKATCVWKQNALEKQKGSFYKGIKLALRGLKNWKIK